MNSTLIIHGAAGRMGRRLLACAVEEKVFEIVGAVDHPDCPLLGQDAGQIAGCETLNVPITGELSSKADVVIDFSLPQAAGGVVDFCEKTKSALVMGTTGLDDSHIARLKQASKVIPIVQATNMSLGMNLLFSLVGKVAKSLGDEYDIEIIEAHHRFKKDAPSGSAMSLAQSICDETDRDFSKDLVHGREGKEALREKGTIGMHALRGGDIIGKHSVMYSTIGETITLSHEAHSRDTFVPGAMRAARWIVNQPPGLYSMKDVLGLE